jgi:hypothetical protein
MKKFIVHLFAILTILLAIEPLVKAEEVLTQTIRGTVTDAFTGQPLVGASVILLGTGNPTGTITDLNGAFRLANVPLGRQSLEVSYVGYHKAQVSNLLLVSGKEVFVDIKLEEKPYEVEAVTIRPDRKKEEALNEMAMVSARTFSVEETERFAGSLGDPARMVANYAGVMTQNDSRNDIIIRGNSPSGVLWRLEGVEIPNPNHFGALGTTGGPVSMINNNLLTNSDFLTGAFPAEFGNALSGAFDLNMRSGNNQKTEFTGQVGFNGFEGGVEGPVKPGKNTVPASYLINFRYSTLELLSDVGFDLGTGTAVPKYKDLTFLLDIPGTTRGRIKVFGLFGNSRIQLGYDEGDTLENSYTSRGVATDFSSGVGLVGISHTRYINEKTRLKSTLSWQRTRSLAKLDSLKEAGAVLDPYVRSTESEDKITFSTQLRHKFSARSQFSTGLTADFFTLSYIDSIENIEYGKFITGTDVAGNLSLLRAFGQYQYKFSDALTGYGGLHFQFSGFNKQAVAEPRLSLKYQASAKHSFNAGYGLHSMLQPKLIYFSQAYIEADNSYLRTNEQLKFTRSHHFVAGYHYSLSPVMRLKIESYYQYLFDVPVKPSFPEFSVINFGDQFGLPRVDSLENRGKGKNYGMEITLEKFLSNGSYFLFTTSLFESKYQTTDKVWRNTAFNGNYVLNLLAGKEWHLNEKNMITADLKLVYAGGRRYVPIDTEASAAAGEEIRDWSKAYEKTYDPYFRTDLRIGFKRNGKGFNQEWGLDLQNVSGFRSLFMEGYDPAKNEVYTVYQQGFIPMFLYRIQF